MGERGQIKIEDTGVYLYTHWGGYRLKNILQDALKKKWRWHDDEYLTRIIFCTMIRGEEAEKTGYGIGTAEHGDLNYPLLTINIAKQTIRETLVKYNKKGHNFNEWSFEQFIKEKFEVME